MISQTIVTGVAFFKFDACGRALSRSKISAFSVSYIFSSESFSCTSMQDMLL
jgi:hypothetical protein